MRPHITKYPPEMPFWYKFQNKGLCVVVEWVHLLWSHWVIWYLGRLQSCQVGHPNLFWIIQFSFSFFSPSSISPPSDSSVLEHKLTRSRSRTTTTAEDNGDRSTFVYHDKMDRRIEVKCWCTNLWTLDNCSFWPAKCNHVTKCTLNPCCCYYQSMLLPSSPWLSVNY